MSKITTPIAILLGSLMISLAMLVSSGVINISSKTTPTPTVAPAAQAPQQGKTVDQMTSQLKSYAGKLGLDQTQFNKCLDLGEKVPKVAVDLADGTSLGVQGTPSFFVNGRPLFIGASPFSEFKKVFDEELNGSVPASAERKTVGVGDLPIMGNQNAKVTFVEFSDYQCPFCGRFYSDAFQQIKKEYIDKGLVKMYYRDYPLSAIHPGAQKGAEAARCAGDQGKYWEFGELVFKNQTDIF